MTSCYLMSVSCNATNIASYDVWEAGHVDDLSAIMAGSIVLMGESKVRNGADRLFVGTLKTTNSTQLRGDASCLSRWKRLTRAS